MCVYVYTYALMQMASEFIVICVQHSVVAAMSAALLLHLLASRVLGKNTRLILAKDAIRDSLNRTREVVLRKT